MISLSILMGLAVLQLTIDMGKNLNYFTNADGKEKGAGKGTTNSRLEN